MKLTHLLAVCVLVCGGVFCTTSLVHSHPPAPEQQQQPSIEYATLVTTAQTVGGSVQFQMIWDAGTGANDIVGQSSQSLDEAIRTLGVRLGAPNTARSNLGELLTAIGNDGWRLIESEGDGVTRIFMRSAR